MIILQKALNYEDSIDWNQGWHWKKLKVYLLIDGQIA